MSPPPFPRIALALLAACALVPASAQPTSAGAQLQRWQAAAGAPADAARGQKLFNTKAGNDLSCASCHGNPPTGPARPNSSSSSHPVTTGGNTSGRWIAASSSSRPGNRRRASSQASALISWISVSTMAISVL